MDRRDRTPDSGPRHDTQPGEAKPAGQIKPGDVEKPRKRPAGFLRRDDAAESAEARQPGPSEDFGRRRDIETADESAEEHDRRHHRGRSDVESSQPV